MYKIACFIVFFSLSGCAVAGGYSELTATQMFIDCVKAKTHTDRVRCETEYLDYRSKLEDQRKRKVKLR